MIIEIVFLNLGPPSLVSASEANEDILAIREEWNPDVIWGCEGVGKGALPILRGRDKVRGHRPPGRAGLWGYFDDDVNPKWTDMEREFPRAIHPHLGPHPARSIYRVNAWGAQFIDAHHPPGWKGSGPARLEHRRALESMLNPWRRDDWRRVWDTAEKRAMARERVRVLGWDSNMSLRVMRAFAERVGGELVGDKIDCLVVRNAYVVDWKYTKRVGNHTLHTDHRHGCLRARLSFQRTA